MFPYLAQRRGRQLLLFAFWLATTPTAALDSFRSIDNRLPNPDRPYDMTGGAVEFPSSPNFTIYDFQFEATYPQQLDVPKPNTHGDWEFDSFFDIAYQAMVSFGLGPVQQVRGGGTAHAIGTAPGGTNPQVFDTELVALNLAGLSHFPDFMFRESPTLESSGVTIREDLCPMCLAPVTYWRISSFFDVFAEVSFDGGATWTPGDQAIHIEQPADPLKLADFNGDGMVDAADYVVWRAGMGTMYTASDYQLWTADFGETTTGSGSSTAAPEPSSCWLLTMAAFGPFLCFRRKARASTLLPGIVRILRTC